MGRQQFYKGNPELKQYFLVNDFSGGINTVDVDERTEDNEFRELLNVELIRTGMIQNRKGWGQLGLLNELLTFRNISLPSKQINGLNTPIDDYALIQIVKNEGNLLSLLEEYDSKKVNITEFNTYGFNYDFELILIYEDSTNIKLSRLTLSSSTAEGRNVFEVIATLAPGSLSIDRPLTGIDTVNYTDYIYFSLSQLSSTAKGFGEYNIVTKEFRFVRDDELPNAFVYKPNPYEATKVGFNVLSQTPLTDVRSISSFLGITGVFLTTYELDVNGKLVDTQTPILTIPLSGKFTVNVLYTGDFETIDTIVQFYIFEDDAITGIPKEKLIDFDIIDVKKEEEIGVVRYAVEIDSKAKTNVYFRVKLKTGTLFSKDRIRSFTTTNAMIDFFNPSTNTKVAVYDNNTKHYTVYNKTALNYNFEKLPGITYEAVTYSPIYDDTLFNFTRVKKWVAANATDFTAQSNPNLKTNYNTLTCPEYGNITLESLNGTSSPFSVNSFNVNHVLKVNKTSLNTTQTKVWETTSNSSFSLSRDVSNEIYNSLTASNVFGVLGLNPTNYANGTILRVTTSVQSTTVFIPKLWVRTSGPGADIQYTGVSQQEIDAIPFSTSVLTFGGGSYSFTAQNYPTFYKIGLSPTISESPTFWRVEEGTPETTTNTETAVRYFIVTTNTSTNYTNCTPYEEKYFKLVDELGGFTSPVVTFDGRPGELKFYYRFQETKTLIEYQNTRTVTNLNELVPVTFGKYLIGTDENNQNAYYRYLGTTDGDIDDFEQIEFADAIEEVEYLDNYLISEPSNLKKIEALNTQGFRILEIGNRLVYYKENIIWFSDLYQFDYIPNYNYIILPLQQNDKITGIIYFKGSYMVFTKERIYKMSGTFGAGDFQVQLVSDAIGCINPYSLKAFNNTIVFMTRDGLYRVKQNYYSGGLENVEKIDKQIDRIIPYNIEVYSVLYNEQYILMYDYPTNNPDTGFNVLKMYYNMEAPSGFPYVKDKYSIMPKIVSKFDDGLYSIRYGKFYRYDIASPTVLANNENIYTDFLPPGIVTDAAKEASKYTTRIRTHKLSFGYPTHEKKFKQIIIKDIANEPVPLIFRIFVNNFLAYTSEQFVTSVNEFGQIEYLLTTEPFQIGNPGLIGNFELGVDQLGDLSARVHKIVFSGKGKDILIDIERRTAQEFSIQDIGYIYKMGKAREDR